MNSIKRILVTRIHGNLPSNDSIFQFVLKAIEEDGASHVLICLGQKDIDTLNIKYKEIDESLKNNINQYLSSSSNSSLNSSFISPTLLESFTVLPVFPWGKYVSPLNAAINYSMDNHFDLISFQSFEYNSSKALWNELISHIDSNTLLVGPVLPGHEFKPQEDEKETNKEKNLVRLRGRTCPWNTCSVWNLKHLGKIGFPLIGDGTFSNRELGGVEEVSTVSVFLHLFPHLKVKLINASASSTSSWSTDFIDPERLAYHEMKMKRKDTQPESQLKEMELNESIPLYVSHLP